MGTRVRRPHVVDRTAEEWDVGLAGEVPGGIEDPFFRRPLWLQTRCAGRILWAYDEEHVDALAACVGARLRERHASSDDGDVRPTACLDEVRGAP
ncbi:hypothetical protein [Streptomyces sp. NBC_00887]|uniref:hypothetical protein n=1 Tax=Streptomyces sp. NBC_00887 TaxID=2975859 RepID=UPI003864E123|nr:hypothetical protein OG844_01955 [Streptomyces sp. NBC_00887]WSY36102.1 hypothetical protein OG844_43645 [Streptomyces sp. NBC_00887]